MAPAPIDASAARTAPVEQSGRTAWSGVLFGVGLIAFVDEAVFHQLLHWHHFYDRGSADAGLVSDGLFHALSWFATIAGLFLLADIRRRGPLRWPRWIGGVLVGAGAFQLYDGTVQHKLFRLHQIRYVDELLVYDIVWIATAIVMLAAGVVLLVRTRRGRDAPTGARAAPAAA